MTLAGELQQLKIDMIASKIVLATFCNKAQQRYPNGWASQKRLVNMLLCLVCIQKSGTRCFKIWQKSTYFSLSTNNFVNRHMISFEKWLFFEKDKFDGIDKIFRRYDVAQSSFGTNFGVSVFVCLIGFVYDVPLFFTSFH